MTTATNILAFSPDDNLGRYLRTVRALPMLSFEDEQALAVRARDGDDTAADQLVMSHMRLVAKITLSYRGSACRSPT